MDQASISNQSSFRSAHKFTNSQFTKFTNSQKNPHQCSTIVIFALQKRKLDSFWAAFTRFYAKR